METIPLHYKKQKRKEEGALLSQKCTISVPTSKIFKENYFHVKEKNAPETGKEKTKCTFCRLGTILGLLAFLNEVLLSKKQKKKDNKFIL